MGEWKSVEIGDIAEMAQGLAINAQSKHLVLSNSDGFPLLRIKDLIKNTQEIFIDREQVPAKCIATSDDLIFSRTGQVGFVFIGKEGVVHNNCFRIIPKKNKLHRLFLYHYFNREIVRDYLESISAGSVQPDMTHKIFKKVRINLPPLPEQKAIASVFSGLDDKIDLLHRQNKTLEAMAETLFRQWFVEEAGDDWEEKSLYDCIKLIGGGTPKTSIDEYWNGDIGWLSAKDITPNHKGAVLSTEKTITTEGLNNSSTKILPRFSTIISARGTVGKYTILAEDMAFSQSNYGIVPKYEECYFFTYLLVANVVDELLSAAYGSVFDTITTKTFKEQYVTVPSEKEIIGFEKEISPMFFKMLNNAAQIKTLENLRNTLLPKLMSGEVRVRYD
ncbi:MAG: restriction endonuclease subunit S [Gammaproteobacteria bacterium]|nr:restriction endonuclease subunit S [Gammaproteobacteria bacterium]